MGVGLPEIKANSAQFQVKLPTGTELGKNVFFSQKGGKISIEILSYGYRINKNICRIQEEKYSVSIVQGKTYRLSWGV